MSTTQHTPGPWHVRTIDESIGSIDAADGSSVAQAQMRGTLRNHNHGERRANTSLIAAAPELLDELIRLSDLLDAHFDRGGTVAGLGTTNKARLLIAKATGNPQ